MKSVNRRRFLAGLACGWAGLSAGLAVARSLPWTLRLSASSIAFSRLPIEQACERIARLGFEGIDIWSAYAGCPHLDDIQRRLGPEGLKVLLARHKLDLFAFSVYAGGYPRYAELLGKAGGGVAVTEAPGRALPAELVPRMRAFLEGMKPQAELAEKQRTRPGHREPRRVAAGFDRFDQGVRRSQQEPAAGNRPGAFSYPGAGRVGHRGHPRRGSAAFLLLRLAV